MADKVSNTTVPNKYNDMKTGPYGRYTGVVALVKDSYSAENAELFTHATPPVYITPYDKWTKDDVIKLHDTFPHVYSGFIAMFNAVASKSQESMTPGEKLDAQDAIKAMTALSGDGNWVNYAKMLEQAGREIQARTEPTKKASSISESMIPSIAKVHLANNGVKLDSQHELVTPDPMAKAAEIVAGMATKLQRAA